MGFLTKLSCITMIKLKLSLEIVSRRKTNFKLFILLKTIAVTGFLG